MMQLKQKRDQYLSKRITRPVTKYQEGGEAGSIALEYVLVSTFATVIGLALLGFAGHTFKQKVEQIMEKFAENHDHFEYEIFGDAP